MAATIREQASVIHVRFGGRSVDVPLASVDLASASDEREVKARLAEFLEVTPRQLADYVIDRHPNGNLTLRPEAVFG